MREQSTPDERFNRSMRFFTFNTVYSLRLKSKNTYTYKVDVRNSQRVNNVFF